MDRFFGSVAAMAGNRSITMARTRSEEHTSELQSPCNLVCRLLLEKKKQPTAVGSIRHAFVKRERRVTIQEIFLISALQSELAICLALRLFSSLGATAASLASYVAL